MKDRRARIIEMLICHDGERRKKKRKKIKVKISARNWSSEENEGERKL